MSTRWMTKRDTAANWTANNPVLLNGEIGYETDSGKAKIGNGTTTWNGLAYATSPQNNVVITGGSITGITDLVVADGGTGASTFTAHSLLLGQAATALTALGAATDGQLPIGSTGADPVLATIAGTSNRVTVVNGAGTITVSGPQDIHTGATPQFTRIGIGTAAHAAALQHIYAGASGQAVVQTGTNLIIESDSATVNYLSFLSPNAACSGIVFGDPEDADVGYGLYSHNDNSMQWRTNGGAVSLTLDSSGNLTNTGTVRANIGFNTNGTDGATQVSAVGKVCDVTALAGGIATAQTQITYAADGTYNFDATSGKVSSITITNGRITGITTAA